jgi:predicted amidohydrolase
MRIALVSLDQKWEDKKENRTRVLAAVQYAVENKVELAVFPEMTLTGFSMQTQVIGEISAQSETLQWFQQVAAQFQIAMIFGYVVLPETDKALNRCVFLSPHGDVLCNYDKIHPFSHSGEDIYYQQGRTLGVSLWHDVSWGLTICYDLRFPQLYQLLSERCSVVINIANWPEHRIMHWYTLLRARAIENQVFMIGVNRVGSDPTGLHYTQSSCVYSPFGEEIIPQQSDACCHICDIDLTEVQRIRSTYPFLQDRYRVREVT